MSEDFITSAPQRPADNGSLGIGLTTRCNYDCRFCVVYDRNHLWGELDAPTVRKILKAHRGRRKNVIFGGGEPTLRSDLPGLVGYAKKLGFQVQITTNGWRFYYKSYCRDLVNAGTDFFCIGFSSHTAAAYERTTKTKGSFSQTVVGIGNLLSLRQRVMTNTVMSKLNYIHLPAIGRRLIRLGLKRCNLSYVVRPPFMPPEEDFPMMNSKETAAFIGHLKKVLDVFIASGVNPLVTRIPLCYMKKYEKYVTSYLNKNDRSICLYNKGGRIINVYDYVLFWKSSACRRCAHDNICPGIQRDSPFAPRV